MTTRVACWDAVVTANSRHRKGPAQRAMAAPLPLQDAVLRPRGPQNRRFGSHVGVMFHDFSRFLGVICHDFSRFLGRILHDFSGFLWAILHDFSGFLGLGFDFFSGFVRAIFHDFSKFLGARPGIPSRTFLIGDSYRRFL